MDLFLFIIGSLLLVAGVVASFMSFRWTAAIAWLGLYLSHLSKMIYIPRSQLLFWAAAAILTVGINTLLPRDISRRQHGLAYIAAGSIVGIFIAIMLSGDKIIPGSIVGAIIGAIAYSRTPQGRFLRFPSTVFINHLAAKGLPTVVAQSIAGIALASYIAQHLILSSINQ